jgi:ankyrin repeat protein
MRFPFALVMVAMLGMPAGMATPANWSKANTPWVDMAASSDHAKALAYIKDGHIQPNIADEDGNTPLMMAAREGNFLAAQELVARGADVNALTNYHYNVLRCALAGRNDEIVALVVAHGAPVNEAFDAGYMPLMDAAAFGSVKAVNLLLAKGAHINARANGGDNALSEAAEKNHPAVIAALVDAGADPNQFAGSRMTPLMWAALAGHPACVRMLIQHGAKLDLQSGDYSLSALQLASGRRATPLSDSTEVVKILLAAGASPTLSDKNGRTALMDATNAQNPDVIKILAASYGVDLKSPNGEGVRALREAMGQKLHLSLQALLEAGVDPNIRYDNDRTPLFDAVEQQDLTAVQLLVAAKTNVNITRSQGIIGNVVGPNSPPGSYIYSVLIAAVDTGSAPMVKALLQAGANPSYKDNLGQTALDRARAKKDSKIIHLLESAAVK